MNTLPVSLTGLAAATLLAAAGASSESPRPLAKNPASAHRLPSPQPSLSFASAAPHILAAKQSSLEREET